jgi:glycosyltransferase involved in cell wall biosynthesis
MTRTRICGLVPTFDNPRTIRRVVERVRAHIPEVIVVDDGSADPGRIAVEALDREGLARVLRRPRNGGKGAAVKDGLRFAARLDFTHCLQIDADGQHDVDDIPRFLEASAERPDALVLGQPTFDDSAPSLRRKARLISRFLTDIQTGRRVIQDPLCGFRVYPVQPAISVRGCGDRMDFDIEIAVRMIWQGCPVVNLPTRVRYLTTSEGGVSHFRMVRDNLLISWAHTKLCTGALARLLTGRPLRSA